MRFDSLLRFASDEHLVDRVRAGSTPAFEAVFDRHHHQLLAFCRHMLGSAADAEDAVQHTFMAAYADLMRSDKPITLRPWLYSIARYRCLTVLRARRERPVGELPEPEVDHLAAEVDAREELRATLADIARLPDDQRAAIVLAELGDASHAEIAQILGCRHDKVKALVFQARSTLANGRTARATPCAEIREQLSVGGVAIRRTSLRHHVRDCPGCREFDEQVRRQRRRLRALLPVAPGFGLKRAVLGAISLPGGGGVVGALGTLGAGGLAATAIVAVAVAGDGRRPATARPAIEWARPALAASVSAGVLPRPAPRVPREPAALPQTAPPPRPAASSPLQAWDRPAEQRPAADAVALHEAAEPPGKPADTPQPAEQSAPETSAAPPEPAVETPRGGKPVETPRRGRPDETPRRGRPDETPRPGRPDDPPRPDETPGRGRPAEPPGKPADPGKPAEPPADPPGKPADPPGKPDAPPGRSDEVSGKPADPPGKPADPPPGAGAAGEGAAR